jgi:hypothetical protein
MMLWGKSKNNQNLIVACIFLLSTLTAGCEGGGGLPTEEQAREKFINSGAYSRMFKNGVVKLNAFKKTNGQAREQSGVKVYLFMYEAEIEYLKNQPKSMFIPGAECRAQKNLIPGCVKRSVGETIVVEGQTLLQLTEQGWQ